MLLHYHVNNVGGKMETEQSTGHPLVKEDGVIEEPSSVPILG
jgi:hypothetical protein